MGAQPIPRAILQGQCSTYRRDSTNGLTEDAFGSSVPLCIFVAHQTSGVSGLDVGSLSQYPLMLLSHKAQY